MGILVSCHGVPAAAGEMSESDGVLAEFVSMVRESYRTTPPKHKKLGRGTLEC
jgi:hypothetical protein